MPKVPSDTVLRYAPAPPTAADVERARAALAVLPANLAGEASLGLPHATIALPQGMVKLLATALSLTAQGRTVDVYEPDVEALTTQQAADHAGISRPYLIQHIEAGELPCHFVGKHRRIYLRDLLPFEQRLTARRRAPDESNEAASSSVVPLASFLAEYDRALARLATFGLRRPPSSRLETYRAEIAEAVDAETRQEFAHQVTSSFVNALTEAADITRIAELDDTHLAQPALREKLGHVNSGQVRETPEGGDERGRDLAFELCAAARFARAQALAGFPDDGSDFAIGPAPWPAQAKRISSIERLGDRLASGRDQLERGERPGVLCADLTRPMRAALGTISARDDRDFERLAQDCLTGFLMRYVSPETLARIARPSVLGLAARFVAYGAVGGQHRIRTLEVWQAIELHDPDARETTEFDLATRALGTSSRGDLADAARSERMLRSRGVTAPTRRRRQSSPRA